MDFLILGGARNWAWGHGARAGPRIFSSRTGPRSDFVPKRSYRYDGGPKKTLDDDFRESNEVSQSFIANKWNLIINIIDEAWE